MEFVVIVTVAIVCFSCGVLFSEKVKAKANDDLSALHGKVDKILNKVDPNATQPPK